MSDESNNELDSPCSCCAACGVAEVDDIKLLPCGDCDLVKYCSDECQDDHRSEHEEACKIRFEELLFKQPECSHRGDCPICLLPLSFDQSKSYLMPCCSKVICIGCRHTNYMRVVEMGLIHTCLFCREPEPKTEEERDKRTMKRAEMNDPAAMSQWGGLRYNEGDISGAIEYWTKAAELGDADAHFKLACLYRDGEGVEKHWRKEMYHMEEAAIAGHPYARYVLGAYEYDSGNIERAVKHWIIASNLGDNDSIKALMQELKEGHVRKRAVKHWIIASNLGDNDSIKALMQEFKEGHVRKDDLAAALRAHKAAVDATKSPEREEAAMWRERERYS